MADKLMISLSVAKTVWNTIDINRAIKSDEMWNAVREFAVALERAEKNDDD